MLKNYVKFTLNADERTAEKLSLWLKFIIKKDEDNNYLKIQETGSIHLLVVKESQYLYDEIVDSPFREKIHSLDFYNNLYLKHIYKFENISYLRVRYHQEKESDEKLWLELFTYLRHQQLKWLELILVMDTSKYDGDDYEEKIEHLISKVDDVLLVQSQLEGLRFGIIMAISEEFMNS